MKKREMPYVDDGGPAFPTPRNEFGENSHSMSLRDWFAGQALASIAASADGASYECVGEACYKFADGLIAARAKAMP